MKKIILLSIITFLSCNALMAQYCVLAGRSCYAQAQPGITRFVLHTIDRTSGNVENMNKVVVTTGVSATLERGKTYKIIIKHSEDITNFPGARNNIRVWLDYNQNMKYTDANETIVSSDYRNPGTDTFTFTVPANAPLE